MALDYIGMLEYRIAYEAAGNQGHEVESLLETVFVGEGTPIVHPHRRHSSLNVCRVVVSCSSPRKQSLTRCWGVAIWVLPTSEAQQVANDNKTEIQLLAVQPNARGRGIASALISACEQIYRPRCQDIVLSTQPRMFALNASTNDQDTGATLPGTGPFQPASPTSFMKRDCESISR
jgi:ribosomal protein S18 acetylase RimI-like enzyme